jgi:hypothetical protein
MKREHVVVLAGEDFVAGLDDEFELFVAKALAIVVRGGGGFFENRVGGDHLARDEIRADAEMFELALRLRAPKFVGGNLDFTEAVGF